MSNVQRVKRSAQADDKFVRLAWSSVWLLYTQTGSRPVVKIVKLINQTLVNQTKLCD
jgi:hypothetical protein